MGKNKNNKSTSRRGFFSAFLSGNKVEKVTLMTAEGKLVEVEKTVVDAADRQKVTNREILQWMKNPSKSGNDPNSIKNQ